MGYRIQEYDCNEHPDFPTVDVPIVVLEIRDDRPDALERLAEKKANDK
jgi:hypothetical protein